MGGRKKSLTKRNVRLQMRDADGRDQRRQLQYTSSDRAFQDFESYRKAVWRMFADAFVMSCDWPMPMRFSWYVDRNGCLRCLSDKGGVQ